MNNKIRKIFLETPIYNDAGGGDGGDGGTQIPQDYEWTLDDRNSREIELKNYKNVSSKQVTDKDGNVFSVVLYDNEDGLIAAARNNPGEPLIGEVIAEKHTDRKYPFPTVGSSHILSNFRGSGLGTELYKIIIDKFGGIISDTKLSGKAKKGSFQFWQKLPKHYNSYIITRSKGKNEIRKVNEFTENDMYNPNSRFVVSIKPLI